MNAKQVKSAQARANIAARLIKTIQPWPRGYGLGRSFDDCFEMGDGSDVKALLLEKAKTDSELFDAMKYRHRDYCNHWVAEMEAAGKE